MATAPPEPTPAPGAHAGLTAAEAAARLRTHGPNLLPQPERRQIAAIARGVLAEPMVLLLLGAAGVYLLLGEPGDALVLLVSVIAVVALTLVQEVRSERALQALRELASPRARVLRDGAVQLLPGAELVPGDVLLLAEGDRVPADARLVEGEDMDVDESLLTGESVPVRRRVAPAGGAGDAATAREDTRVLAGTLVVRGRGTAVVEHTGRGTAIGRVGSAMAGLHPAPTRLQREMRGVVAAFATLGLASALVMVLLHHRAHGDWLQAMLAGITLAIANIPEEFPVVLAVFLALGAWRMARHKALVRRAAAIEALGSVTVLCSDKTGTLTENRMAVAALRAGEVEAAPGAALVPVLRVLLDRAEQACDDRPHDPMERAIREAAAGAIPPGRADWTRVRAWGLDNALLATTHAWRVPGQDALRIACKGAPEAVAALCGLDAAARDAVLAQVAAMADRGLRVLGVADAAWTAGERALPADPRGFAFAWRGLVALADPLRAGAADAVAEARAAGIRVLMLTGDHAGTARAIAGQAGIARPDAVVTGDALEALDDAGLAACAAATDVFARVRPNHKLRLVHALQRDGGVVAMTGDGVNDAPALMAADVGVAMGQRGTDVAREAATIVLLDDDFRTVVRAVRMGRTVYDNIARAVRYILAVHVPITGLALLPLLAGGPMVLLPVHVVFLEMIIDPASTLVFEREPARADVMRRPPRPAAQRLLGLRTLAAGFALGGIAFAALAWLFLAGRAAGLPPPQVGALCFSGLVAGNLALIVAHRQGGAAAWRLARDNAAFWIVCASALALLALVTRWPVAGARFGFAPPPPDWHLLALAGPVAAVLLADAALRALARRAAPRGPAPARRPAD